VIGMALVISSPFMLASQSSVIQLKQASDYLQVDNTLDNIEESAIALDKRSYPARRIVRFQSPRAVENVYNPQFGNSSALIVEVSRASSRSNQSILFDFNFHLENPERIAGEGNYRISLKKHPESVNASVVS